MAKEQSPDLGLEQPHEYLAGARGRECMLCLHDKDHPIHREPATKEDNDDG